MRNGWRIFLKEGSHLRRLQLTDNTAYEALEDYPQRRQPSTTAATWCAQKAAEADVHPQRRQPSTTAATAAGTPRHAQPAVLKEGSHLRRLQLPVRYGEQQAAQLLKEGSHLRRLQLRTCNQHLTRRGKLLKEGSHLRRLQQQWTALGPWFPVAPQRRQPSTTAATSSQHPKQGSLAGPQRRQPSTTAATPRPE